MIAMKIVLVLSAIVIALSAELLQGEYHINAAIFAYSVIPPLATLFHFAFYILPSKL